MARMYHNTLKLEYPVAVHDFDVFPRVLCAGKQTLVTVKPLHSGVFFLPETSYDFQIWPQDEGDPIGFPGRDNGEVRVVQPDPDGACRLPLCIPTEQEVHLRIYLGEEKIAVVHLYVVGQDLVGRFPFRGDLHVHTCRSDGRQSPGVVVANYRKTGYDFIGLTDHHCYWSGLEALEYYKDVPIECEIIPGEEVHTVHDFAGGHANPLHLVNFGGEYSINAVAGSDDTSSRRSKAGELWAEGTHPYSMYETGRSSTPPPPRRTKEAFWAMIDAYKTTLDWSNWKCPEEEKYVYACSHWIFEEIRNAGGLAIYAHPLCIANSHVTPMTLFDYFMEQQPFDALELLNGDLNMGFRENGTQVAAYIKHQIQGRRYPIVASTDSHDSFDSEKSHRCHTLVFARENKRKALIQAIKDRYSVAVDTNESTPYTHGDFRLIRYANYLERCYFPVHDELCFEEGRAMKDYLNGDARATAILEALAGRVKAYQAHVFDF